MVLNGAKQDEKQKLVEYRKKHHKMRKNALLLLFSIKYLSFFKK